MNDWYLHHLVCPVDKSELQLDGDMLKSRHGRTYPVVDGIPVMLLSTVDPTHGAIAASIQATLDLDERRIVRDTYFVDSLGISETERQAVRTALDQKTASIDPVVAALVAATNGIGYKDQVGRLDRIPIPAIPDDLGLPRSGVALDIGSSWGRWSMAMAARGASIVVGIDPSIGALAAARRLAHARAITFLPVCADARYLPFKANSFDAVISYSVLQHFSFDDAKTALAEVQRVGKIDCITAIQMPNRFGIRCLWHQLRRGFSSGSDFDVRYGSLTRLAELFSVIGPLKFSVDCYFGLGLQPTDQDLMSPLAGRALAASEWLKSTFGTKGWPVHFADSVWCVAARQ